MSLISIRGAITTSLNSEEEILLKTKELIEEIEKKNHINNKDKVISIIFTCTKDLDKVYPARAARELGYLNTSLMCLQEMHVENSLEKCIRVSIFYETEKQQQDAVHVYLEKAKSLRPDLGGKVIG